MQVSGFTGEFERFVDPPWFAIQRIVGLYGLIGESARRAQLGKSSLEWSARALPQTAFGQLAPEDILYGTPVAQDVLRRANPLQWADAFQIKPNLAQDIQEFSAMYASGRRYLSPREARAASRVVSEAFTHMRAGQAAYQAIIGRQKFVANVLAGMYRTDSSGAFLRGDTDVLPDDFIEYTLDDFGLKYGTTYGEFRQRYDQPTTTGLHQIASTAATSYEAQAAELAPGGAVFRQVDSIQKAVRLAARAERETQRYQMAGEAEYMHAVQPGVASLRGGLGGALREAEASIRSFADTLDKRGKVSVEQYSSMLQESLQSLDSKMKMIDIHGSALSKDAVRLKYEVEQGVSATEIDPRTGKPRQLGFHEHIARSRELQAVQLEQGQLDAAMLRLRERYVAADAEHDRLRPELQRRRENFRRSQTIQHALWAPWQVEMMRAFGELPAQEAFLYAAEVDKLQSDAAYLSGGTSVGVSAEAGRRSADAAFAQYYRGRGAESGFLGISAFINRMMADNPALARTLGSVQPWLTGAGYLLMGELYTSQMTGGRMGLFLGDDGKLFGRHSVVGNIPRFGRDVGAAFSLMGQHPQALGTIAGMGAAGATAAGLAGAGIVAGTAAVIGAGWEAARSLGALPGRQDFLTELGSGARNIWGEIVKSHDELFLVSNLLSGMGFPEAWKQAQQDAAIAGAWAAGYMPSDSDDDVTKARRALVGAGYAKGDRIDPQAIAASRAQAAAIGLTDLDQWARVYAGLGQFEGALGMEAGDIFSQMAQNARSTGFMGAQATQYVEIMGRLMQTLPESQRPYAMAGQELAGMQAQTLMQLGKRDVIGMMPSLLRQGVAQAQMGMTVVDKQIELANRTTQRQILGMGLEFSMRIPEMLQWGMEYGQDPMLGAQLAARASAAYGGATPRFGADYFIDMARPGAMRAWDMQRYSDVSAALAPYATQFRWDGDTLEAITRRMGDLDAYGRQQFMRSFGLTSGFDWSNAIRGQLSVRGPGQLGIEEYDTLASMITHDTLGRPIYFQPQREMNRLGVRQDRGRQELYFAQAGTQLYHQEQLMMASRALEDFQYGALPDGQSRAQRDARFYADLNLDRMRLNIRQAEFNLGVGAGYQDRQRALQRQMMEMQYQWRSDDIGVAGYRANVQYQWQREDFAVNRNVLNLQSRWEMEDLDEAIRFSSGRDRIRLMRQRDRTVTMQNVQRSQLDRQEARGATAFEWGEEDRAKALDRLNKEMAIKREMVSLDEESIKKQREFAREQIELMRREEGFLTTKRGEMEDQFKLEDDYRKDRRESEDASLQAQKDRLAQEKKFYEEMKPLQDAYILAMETYEDNMQAHWLAANGYMAEFKKFLEEELAEGKGLYEIWRKFWQIPENVTYPSAGSMRWLDRATRGID
jgi:hypothetical protein